MRFSIFIIASGITIVNHITISIHTNSVMKLIHISRNGSKKYGTKEQIDELVEALEETGRMDIVKTIRN